MIYQGKSLSAELLENGIVEFKFDAKGSVNKFDHETFNEYKLIVEAINNCSDAKAVMVTSAKSTFIVGADITEFLTSFNQPEETLTQWAKSASDIFDSFEDIQLPTIQEGKVVTYDIKEGEIFLLPARIPHSPQRPANTVGLVIERMRTEEELDYCYWYCENCNNELHKMPFHLGDIVKQLPKILSDYYKTWGVGLIN